MFDNVSWLREAWSNPVFLNPDDAAEAGIVDGDTVQLTSAYGKIIRPASLTGCVRPGVIGLPHGAWVDVDEETGIDRAGADNYDDRSEERRVGKECRSRWSPYH